MKKILKYSLYGIAGVIALLVVVVAVISATFNPNDYKDDVIQLVKDKKNRTLHIDGDIKLSFWPKIGADLGKVSISEHQSETEFASVNSVKVALAVLPLLKKELVVDTVYVDGANAKVIKRKDGSFNFDDLLSKEEDESEAIKFDVQGIKITNSAASYHDESTGGKYSISQLNIQTGHVALAEPIDLETDFMVKANQPVVDAKTMIKGQFLFDPETKHFSVKGLDSKIKGTLLGGKDVDIALSGAVDAVLSSMQLEVDQLKLIASGHFDGANNVLNLSAPEMHILKDQVSSKEVTVSLIQTKPESDIKLNMVLANMKGSPKAVQSTGIRGDVAISQGKRKVSGQFSSPLSANIENLIFDIPKLAGNLDIQDPNLPNGAIKGSFAIGAHADLKKEQASSQFNLTAADTRLNGDVSVEQFKTPNIRFNLNADKINLNQLLGKASQASNATPSSQQNKTADLSALNTLLLDGKVNIGSIVYDPYRVTGLNVAIKADGKKLALTGLNVKVDDSQIKGNLAISQFSKPLYSFDIDIDQVDLDRYTRASEKPAANSTKSSSDKPLDLSALKALNADGSLRVGHLKYGKTKASNIHIKLDANGEKLNLNPLSAKVDDSQIQARLGISQFSQPAFSFNVNIDKLDADRYIAKSEPSTSTTTKSNIDTPIDLSALKKLNATGEANIGWLKIANVKTQNVKVGLKAADGIATLSPFAANLYQGSMNGSLKVDARGTPSIAFKQAMKSVSIGPLMVDAINNDMLSGTGSVDVDITTQGATVGALKKALAGNASLNLADGAVKGIDIAGTIRDMKSKINVLKSKDAVDADQSKKTDFSEMTATFTIKNGVAHNEDLAMKAPILRLAKGDSKGDVDIANEKINYTAKPTIVGSLKGQGGKEVDQLAGIGIPVKITGTFAAPKFGMDMAAVGAALAKSAALDKLGGEKGAAVKELLNNENKADAVKNLLGGKTKSNSSTESGQEEAKPAEGNIKEKALKKLLNF